MSSEQGNTDQRDGKSEKSALQEASSMEESTTQPVKTSLPQLNSKAKLKQSHVSLSLLNDNRKDEWLLLRAGGTRDNAPEFAL